MHARMLPGIGQLPLISRIAFAKNKISKALEHLQDGDWAETHANEITWLQLAFSELDWILEHQEVIQKEICGEE